MISTWTGAMLIRYFLFRSVWPFESFETVLCKTSRYIALVSLSCMYFKLAWYNNRSLYGSQPTPETQALVKVDQNNHSGHMGNVLSAAS